MTIKVGNGWRAIETGVTPAGCTLNGEIWVSVRTVQKAIDDMHVGGTSGGPSVHRVHAQPATGFYWGPPQKAVIFFSESLNI